MRSQLELRAIQMACIADWWWRVTRWRVTRWHVTRWRSPPGAPAVTEREESSLLTDARRASRKMRGWPVVGTFIGNTPFLNITVRCGGHAANMLFVLDMTSPLTTLNSRAMRALAVTRGRIAGGDVQAAVVAINGVPHRIEEAPGFNRLGRDFVMMASLTVRVDYPTRLVSIDV